MRANIAAIAPLLLAGALLLGAGPAQAIFVQTPLTVSGDKSEAQVGDDIRFDLSPGNDSEQQRLAGKTVRLVWEEIQTGEFQEGAQPRSGTVAEAVALDAKARGSATWQVPAEAKDLNVMVVARLGEEHLGQFHVRVGDAEPIAFLMGSPGGNLEDAEGNGTGNNGSGTGGTGAGDGQRSVPGPALVLASLGVGAAALLAARRR